jgi:multidrug efflux pump subunit AcrA (membrane-fusion protein)
MNFVATTTTRTTPVVASPVRQGTLDIYLFALGTVTPVNAVVVRSRVDGQLMKVAFDEGQIRIRRLARHGGPHLLSRAHPAVEAV